jgi:Cu(I)/Ag(I) efflux system membrane fusion protein
MEKMPLIWIKTGHELFESRMVETGLETKQFVEIRKGLSPGDILVSSGAYLINSEFIIKKGSSAQHKH